MELKDNIQSASPKTKRVEWIDTAKGISILLIVYSHVCQMYGTKGDSGFFVCLSVFFDNFAVPSFFLFSGFFFKTYDSVVSFMKNKTNRLLIPFFLFYIFSCPIRAIFNYFSSVDHSVKDYLLDFYYNHCGIVNGPLWFLLSLFEVCVFFFCVRVFCKNDYLVGAISVLIGLLGLYLGYNDVQLPMTLATSFTCLPFFSVGYFIKNRTNMISPSPWDKYLCVTCVIICLLTTDRPLWYLNSFTDTSYATAHICGISGSLMIMFISKMMGTLTIVTYLGKYSLVVLCTHIIVFKSIAAILRHTPFHLNFLVVFFVLMLIELLLIPIMIKYTPHMTAQKDLIE